MTKTLCDICGNEIHVTTDEGYQISITPKSYIRGLSCAKNNSIIYTDVCTNCSKKIMDFIEDITSEAQK